MKKNINKTPSEVYFVLPSKSQARFILHMHGQDCYFETDGSTHPTRRSGPDRSWR